MILFGKCSEVKVKVVRNRSSKVKYKYPKKLLKYSNKVFLLRYYTTLVFGKASKTSIDQNSAESTISQSGKSM